MILLRAAAPALAGVLLVTVACDASSTPAASTSVEVDEWGENEVPPTRDEILAEPAAHSADAIAQALVEVAESADAAALPSVLALVDDRREEIRWHVVLALKSVGGDEADAALERLANDDPSEMVRDEAAGR